MDTGRPLSKMAESSQPQTNNSSEAIDVHQSLMENDSDYIRQPHPIGPPAEKEANGEALLEAMNKCHNGDYVFVPNRPEPSTPTSTTPSFDQFPILPTELRLKVWFLASNEPRDITTAQNYPIPSTLPTDSSSAMSSTSHNGIRLISTAGPVPLVLQINQESRSVGLQHYALSFHSLFNGKPIYINWACDRFVFDTVVVLVPFYFPSLIKVITLEWPSPADLSHQGLLPPFAAMSELRQFEENVKHLVLGGATVLRNGVLSVVGKMKGLKTLVLEAPRTPGQAHMKPEDKPVILEKLQEEWRKAGRDDMEMPEVKFVFRYKLGEMLTDIVGKTGPEGMGHHYYAADRGFKFHR